MKKRYLYSISIITGFLFLAGSSALAQVITVSDVPTTLCANESFTLSFTTSGFTPGVTNQYIADLSDETGSFLTPTFIGSYATTATSGTIYVTLPYTAVLSPTSAYRIRVSTTDPLIINADNGADIVINCLTKDYYWTGGAGNWSDLNHWEYSTDLGFTITSPADVLPTQYDNVNFDNLSFPSGGQLTIDVPAVCNDMYWDPGSGANNPVLWANSSNSLSVYGDFELDNGVYRDLYYIYFNSIKKYVSLNFADNLLQYDPNTTWWKSRYLIFNTNGSWDLNSEVKAENLQSYGGGTFYSNDFPITLDNELYMSGGNFDAGSSIISARYISLYSPYIMDNSNIFLDGTNGTSAINGTQIYNNVTITSGLCNIANSNTYNNLTLTTGGGMSLNGGTTQTINTSFLANGGGRSQIAVINSQQPGSTATILLAGTASASADYVSITDNIIDNGAAGTYSATNAIDGGNNTGWIFTLLTPLEYYWIGGTGDWSDVTHWVTSSDGGVTTALATEGPGPLDNVYFNANSFPTSGTLTIDNPVTINNMTWEPGSGATKPEIFADWGNRLTIMGNFTMDNGVTRRILSLTFNSSNGMNQIDMADNTDVNGNIEFLGGGIWDLQSDLSSGGNDIYFNEGTLNTNGFSMTFGSAYIYSDLTTLNLFGSDIYVSYQFYNYAPTAPTFNAGTSTFYFDNQSSTNRIGGNSGLSFNNVVFMREGQIKTSNSFNSLTVNPGSSLILDNGTTQTISASGTLNLAGTRSQFVSIASDSPGIPATLMVSGATVNADFISLTDNTIDNGSSIDVSATNALDNGGNLGWAFSAIIPYDFRWIGGAGDWNDMAHWEFSDDSGATWAPATDTPGPLDNVFFDTNSFPAGGTLSITEDAQCNNMTWQAGSGSNFPILQSDWPIELIIHGSLQMADGVTRSLYRLNFTSDATGNTISMADNLFTWGDVDFNGTGTWDMLDSLTAVYLNIRGGTLNTNGNPINIIEQLYLDYNPATVNLGTSNVYLRSIWSDAQNMMFNAQSSTFHFNANGNTSYIRGNYTINFNDVVLEGKVQIQDSYGYNNFTIMPGADIRLGAGLTQSIAGTFTAMGTRSNMIKISSLSSGSTSTLMVNTLATGLINNEYLLVTDNVLDNGVAATDQVAVNSIDGGNNTGWDFSTSPLTPLDYYWIGGTGNWSDVSHWATTDGGSTFQPFPPGLVDNVSFTSNSFPTGGEITLDQAASCNNMTWNDGTTNPTITGGDNSLTIGGNLTIANGVNRNIQTIVFNSSTTNQLILGDNRFDYSRFEFRGTGIWNLIDSLAANTVTLYGGTFNTNGKPINLVDEFGTSGSDPINFSFGTSKMKVRNISNYSNNLTSVDVGTSILEIVDGGNIWGNDLGFYDVTILGDAWIYPNLDVANNLTLNPGSRLMINPSSILTVVNLVANGTRPSPVTIKSTQEGQQGTISQASGTVSASQIILKDNNATGGATFVATDAYDKGNNAGWNITPIVGQDYYWMAATGNWSDRNSWSLTDGTNVVPATAPGPADNIFVTTNSPLNGGGDLNLDIPAICTNMTWSTTGTGIAVNGDYENPLVIQGSLTLATGVATNLDLLKFNSDNTGNTLTMAGNLGNAWINIEFNGTGDWTMTDSLYASNIDVNGGTFSTGGFPLSANSIRVYNYNSTTSTLDLGSSNVYVATIDGYNPTLIPGTSTIYLAANATIYNSWQFNNMEIDGSARFYGDNTFNTLTIQPGSEVRFNAGGTQTITQLNAVGQRSRPISLKSTTDGSQATILQASGVVAGNYLTIQDNNALGAASFAAQNSIDNGNVNGWNFTPITPRNYYWVGGDGNWSEYSTHWANADGGTTFYDASPGPLDNVFFTANAFPADGTLTLDFPVSVDNMDWTGSTSAVTISHADDWDNTLTIGGSLTMANGVTRNADIEFNSYNTGNTIFLADNLYLNNWLSFYGTGDWTLTGTLGADAIRLFNGTFYSGNFDVNSNRIELHDDNISYWGTSTVTTQQIYNYLNNNATFNSETSTFDFAQTTDNYIRGSLRFYIAIFDGDSYIDNDNIFFNASATAGTIQLAGNQAFNSLTMAAGTNVSLSPGTTQTISATLDLTGSVNDPIVVNSFTEGQAAIFSMPPTATVIADYVHIKDNTAKGGATFGTTNSSDFGNVTGWTGLLTGQTITFDPLNDRPVANGSFDLSATSTSSLPVSFEIASGNATISGTTVTPTAAGLVAIKALQNGDATFGNALPMIRYIHLDATTEPNELGNMKEAKLVLGQPDAQTNDELYTDITLPRTYDAAVNTWDPSTGMLAVANGTRVMIYNQLPANNTTPADIVLGHNDFTTDITNTITASTFSSRAYSVAFEENTLFVGDNSRVLLWNITSLATGAPADLVIGQADFTSTKNGTSSSQFSSGQVIMVTTLYDANAASTKLIISDAGNNRVLIYNQIPMSNGAPADIVIGQPDFTSNTAGDGADELNFPIHTAVTPDGKLLIADYGNNRILIYNNIPTSNGVAADLVLGQADFGLSDSGVGPNSYFQPTGVSVSRTGKLAIADFGNHRVLIYNSVPTDNTTPPDYVIGQPDLNSNSANYNSISGRTLYYPISAQWDISENLYIADRSNSRLLVYGAADLEAPVASNASYPTTIVDNTGSGTITLTDRSGISMADLYYRSVSSPDPAFNFTSLTLASNTNNDYNYTFEAGNLISTLPLGVEFYVVAKDGLGNTLDDSGSIARANIQYTNGLPITNFGVGNQQNQYRMFSVPLELANKDGKAVFDEIITGAYDTKTFRLFSWPGGVETNDYTEYGSGLTNIDIGKGYFALAASGATVMSGQGSTPVVDASNPFTSTLVPGWNMIGNPYDFTVNWSDVLTASGITTAEAANPQSYNGSFSEKTSISSGEGVFVNNPSSNNVTLVFPVVNSAGGRIMEIEDNINSLADDSWEVRFLHQDKDGYDVELGAVGMEKTSVYSFDKYDRINPPAIAEQEKAEFNHPEFFEPSFKKDIRQTAASESWSFTYTAAPKDDLDEIYWDNSYYGYSSPDIYLVDKTHFEVINMKEKDSYQFNHGGKTKFEVYYGYDALDALLPGQLEVQTPFPNPFTEQVKINVGLPKADQEYKLMVAIYNTMGKQVAILNNSYKEGGYYNFNWQGTNDSGQEVPKGIYAYRVLISGAINDVATGKIVKE